MELVTIKEISIYLKVKESTLYSWVHNGIMPFYKLNGLLRFDMAEIEAWVRASKPSAPEPIMELTRPQTKDIHRIAKRAIEEVKQNGYNPSKRETSLNQALRKEV
ncbi:MAG: helix-turn-helix domain-containing protein [Deltaproteobacteria bacterium]|nr:helix-turn-helix domain-containing protein [Deltaproteobacteria bacterium]